MKDDRMFDHVKKLFEEKRDYFVEVKAITKNSMAAIASESDVEEKADLYASMMSKREHIFNKIDVIDEALKSSEYFKTSCNAEFGNVKDEIKDIIREILSMEEKSKAEGTRIKNELALKIKGLRSGKEISVAYNRDAFYSGISRFDSNN